MVDLSVDIAGIKMKNPVTVASGTFGIGKEFSEFLDLSALGAIVTKSVTLKPRKGNPSPRIWETPSGMLNSVGLQNNGIDYFIKKDLPHLKKYKVPIIVNVAGDTPEEYAAVVEKLNYHAKDISGIELNISCPNVKKGCMVFGVSPTLASEVTKVVRKRTELPLIVKLSPNVGDIVEIALSVVKAGASALSLVNTILGMAIDTETFESRLGSVVGGLSGPAIRPIALRMIFEVARSVKVPVIGMGGIMEASHAIEFLLAGASAVSVGTANFVDPEATAKIIDGIENFLEERQIPSVKDIIGKVKI